MKLRGHVQNCKVREDLIRFSLMIVKGGGYACREPGSAVEFRSYCCICKSTELIGNLYHIGRSSLPLITI